MISLNIIYNLAALNDTETVKKMSLHLADYFRFILKANRDTITLKEELMHIENYMTIQKIRFPDKLQCTFEGMDAILNYPIAALTGYSDWPYRQAGTASIKCEDDCYV